MPKPKTITKRVDREKELLAIIWGILNCSTTRIEHEVAIHYMEKIERLNDVPIHDIWVQACKMKKGTLVGLLDLSLPVKGKKK